MLEFPSFEQAERRYARRKTSPRLRCARMRPGRTRSSSRELSASHETRIDHATTSAIRAADLDNDVVFAARIDSMLACARPRLWFMEFKASSTGGGGRPLMSRLIVLGATDSSAATWSDTRSPQGTMSQRSCGSVQAPARPRRASRVHAGDLNLGVPSISSPATTRSSTAPGTSLTPRRSSTSSMGS